MNQNYLLAYVDTFALAGPGAPMSSETSDGSFPGDDCLLSRSQGGIERDARRFGCCISFFATSSSRWTVFGEFRGQELNVWYAGNDRIWVKYRDIIQNAHNSVLFDQNPHRWAVERDKQLAPKNGGCWGFEPGRRELRQGSTVIFLTGFFAGGLNQQASLMRAGQSSLAAINPLELYFNHNRSHSVNDEPQGGYLLSRFTAKV
ncbi:hypothetical protein C8F01DRAFT_1085492 [Mycena amicta]|nr:hypothetical protein C8F01DRAFT_1085492 [Mycena amicta]